MVIDRSNAGRKRIPLIAENTDAISFFAGSQPAVPASDLRRIHRDV
jgi:hypothetical protein